MNNKEFRKFILAEIDKIEIESDYIPDSIITFFQYRMSVWWKKEWIAPMPKRVIKIKWKTGEWVLKPYHVDLRDLYNKVNKMNRSQIIKSKSNAPSLADGLVSGQMEFIPNDI